MDCQGLIKDFVLINCVLHSLLNIRIPNKWIKIIIISDSSDSDYSHIYGRLPIPTRGLRKFPTKPLFLSQWE